MAPPRRFPALPPMARRAAWQRYYRIALEPPDLDRLGIALVVHARAFAERIHGTDATAAHAEDVRVEDVLGAAAHVARGDLLDERGNVDVRRTGARARRVEAEQATVGFELGVVRRERRIDVGKILPFSALCSSEPMV